MPLLLRGARQVGKSYVVEKFGRENFNQVGQLKSLKLFMEEKQSKLGLRISQQPLSYKDQLLSLPLYMIGEIDRLFKIIAAN